VRKFYLPLSLFVFPAIDSCLFSAQHDFRGKTGQSLTAGNQSAQVRAGMKQMSQHLSAIEAEIQSLMGKLKIEMKGTGIMIFSCRNYSAERVEYSVHAVPRVVTRNMRGSALW
jgi:hypothetical protein